MTAEFFGNAVNPDEEFFVKRLESQVLGKGVMQIVSSHMVGWTDIKNLPFFLCGGGSRLMLYRKLIDSLERPDQLQARLSKLAIPEFLEAPGLPPSDYDRLSVAYGLSFVNVGQIVFAKPMSVTQKRKEEYGSEFIDKDQC
jgi:hypothetical protein